MISRPDSAILPWLAATTAATMATMLSTEISGSTSTAVFTRAPSRRWAIRPRMIGSSTILRMDMNMALNDTGSHSDASSQISAGVTSGASRVVTAVIDTDSARSVSYTHLVAEAAEALPFADAPPLLRD